MAQILPQAPVQCHRSCSSITPACYLLTRECSDAAKHGKPGLAKDVQCHPQIPDGYTSIKEETSLMAGEAFFVPGSTERSWNATTPSTRILVRDDLHQQVTALHMVQHLLQLTEHVTSHLTRGTYEALHHASQRNPAHKLLHLIEEMAWCCGRRAYAAL